MRADVQDDSRRETTDIGAEVAQPYSPPTKPESSPLNERAYVQLRRAIADMVLQPGEPLTEASLAEWLGIGRTPVREALKRLGDEGLVDAIPRKGYFVSKISARAAQEIYEMLEGLEGMAIKLAAERATPECIARLEEAVRQQQEALAREDLDAWIAADEAFHVAVLDMADNRRIRRIIEPLNAQLHRLRVFTIRLRPKPTRSTDTHAAQLAAIRAGDGRLARELLQEHRAYARRMMVDLIRQYVGVSGGL